MPGEPGLDQPGRDGLEEGGPVPLANQIPAVAVSVVLFQPRTSPGRAGSALVTTLGGGHRRCVLLAWGLWASEHRRALVGAGLGSRAWSGWPGLAVVWSIDLDAVPAAVPPCRGRVAYDTIVWFLRLGL